MNTKKPNDYKGTGARMSGLRKDKALDTEKSNKKNLASPNKFLKLHKNSTHGNRYFYMQVYIKKMFTNGLI